MTKSKSPFLTAAPGLKLTCSRNPETRARRSTDWKGSVVPVYSRYRVTGRCTGCATVTSGGSGGTNALVLGLQPHASHRAAMAVTVSAERVALRRGERGSVLRAMRRLLLRGRRWLW